MLLIILYCHPNILVDLSPPLGTSRGEEEYAQLNKSTMEGMAIGLIDTRLHTQLNSK